MVTHLTKTWFFIKRSYGFELSKPFGQEKENKIINTVQKSRGFTSFTEFYQMYRLGNVKDLSRDLRGQGGNLFRN